MTISSDQAAFRVDSLNARILGEIFGAGERFRTVDLVLGNRAGKISHVSFGGAWYSSNVCTPRHFALVRELSSDTGIC